MILKVNKDLSVSPVKSYKNAFIVSLAINVILLFTSMLNLTTEIISVVTDTVTIERTIEDMKLTDSGLTAELVKHGCVLPAVAVATLPMIKTDVPAAPVDPVYPVGPVTPVGPVGPV